MSLSPAWKALALLMAVLPVAVSADTLYLRNGQRIEGELVSVRNDTIEFEERRNYGSGRLRRFDRDEVARIEFDNWGGGNSDTSDRPAGMRERQVTVSADTDWNDAGIDVRSGQTVYFEATGQVRWGKDRRDGPAPRRMTRGRKPSLFEFWSGTLI